MGASIRVCAAQRWVGADEALHDGASPLNPVFYGRELALNRDRNPLGRTSCGVGQWTLLNGVPVTDRRATEPGRARSFADRASDQARRAGPG
jgi:hypothetical protein